MRVLVTHDHRSAESAARHCWTLVQGGWKARAVQRGGQHFVEVGAWAGYDKNTTAAGRRNS